MRPQLMYGINMPFSVRVQVMDVETSIPFNEEVLKAMDLKGIYYLDMPLIYAQIPLPEDIPYNTIGNVWEEPLEELMKETMECFHKVFWDKKEDFMTPTNLNYIKDANITPKWYVF